LASLLDRGSVMRPVVVFISGVVTLPAVDILAAEK
jgi:hypothetical protein